MRENRERMKRIKTRRKADKNKEKRKERNTLRERKGRD